MLSRIRWFTSFSTRQTDWLTSLHLAGFGGFLLLPPPSLEGSAGLVAASRVMTENTWGALFLGLGGAAVYALHRDAWWSPFVRILAMAAAILALSVFAHGFLPRSPGAYMFLSTAFLFCGNCLLAASRDAGSEYRQWRGRD